MSKLNEYQEKCRAIDPSDIFHELDSNSDASYTGRRCNNIFITAILPAHNESAGIARAIESIRKYAAHIIVACDNCSDDTAREAIKAGADDVFNTVDNHHRKSGALNQALERHVDWHVKNQYLLIMDADTQVVSPKRWFQKATSLVYPNRPYLSREAIYMPWYKYIWIKNYRHKLYHELYSDKAFDCVGSIFQAPKHLSHRNYLTEGQKLEWEGYASKIERTRKVFVLTGTCSLFSANALKKVYILHDGKYFYNDKSLTEDFFMTLSLKECGARLISPTHCICTTATKRTMPDLIRQRRRWYMGAIQALFSLKADRVTLPYIGQQVMLFVSTFAFMLFLVVSLYIYITQSVDLTLFWSVVFIGYDIDEVAKIWKYSTWADRIYAMSMIGDLMYSFTLQCAYLLAVYDFIDGKKVYWNGKHQQN